LSAGFSFVELGVTVAVLAVVLALSAPNIGEWVGKAKVRAGAELLVKSLHFAQNAAVSSNRLVEISLVDSVNPPTVDAVPADNGSAWIVRTVPDVMETAASLQAGAFEQGQNSVQIRGSDNKTLVFSGIGQIYTSIPDGSNTNTYLTSTRAYQIVTPSGQYQACVLVQPGGNIKWCDPTIAAGVHACPGSATQSCL